MSQKILSRCILKLWFLTAAIGVITGFSSTQGWADTSPKYYAVEVSARVQVSPPQINLVWETDPRATAYRVYRKLINATSWTPVTSLPGNATYFSDSDVSEGSAYEYQIAKSTSYGYSGYGYIYAGIDAPVVDNRGKLILIVDSTYAAQLSPELTRLEQDLVGDGWTVLRHDVSPNDPPPKVKGLIQADYYADPSNVKSVFLFGHVAVPYSGDFNPDNHDNHRGAWPADAYYGDVDGNWTDNQVYSTSAERDRNWNVPGDGKFDQTQLPSDVDLQVGRVDLSNMTCFSNKTPSRSELDLLRQYLNKDHNFRHRIFSAQRRGLVCDNFGERNGEAFAASGWRNFAAFFGAENVSEVPGGNYFSTISKQSYLWSYGTGGGSFYTCDGIGSSDDFATNDIESVFMMFLGSYFGDWDNESNFLRAPLGSTSYGLTVSWAGRPHWFYHHMGLGETIGFSTRLSQNNGPGGLYAALNEGSREVHVALMGDPSLRMHPVVPPSGLTAARDSQGITLNWSASADTDVQGYYVYRASSVKGPFSRITRGSPIATTSFSDLGAAETYTYMVRAIKLEKSGSGTYFNPSQGIFVSPDGSGVTVPVDPSPTVPSAPVIAASAPSSSVVTLTWQDGSSNETGFRIQRRAASSPAYVDVGTAPANAVGYTDGDVVSGAQYSYRVAAYNATGASVFSNESTVTVPAGSVSQGPAQAVFAGADYTTQGNWKGTYGIDGYNVIGNAASYPGYAVVTSAGGQVYTWRDSTSDSRALQKAAGTDRLAACWFNDSSFTTDINLTDGKTHRLALYCLDWDTTSRSETIEVLNASSGQVLDSENISAFGNGIYLVWDVVGHIRIRFTKNSGNNAVLMGIFFNPSDIQLGGASGFGNISVAPGATISLAGGQFEAVITGSPGQRYSIEASNDLTHWIKISEVTLSGTTASISDPAAGQNRNRFYRAVKQP